MTNTTTPIEATFELQRQAINHSQRLFEQGLDFQQNALETFLQNGLSVQRSAQRQGTELSRKVFDAQVDAFEAAVDDDEFRAAIDRQFEDGAEQTQELLNRQFEQGSDLFQQLLHAQLDAFESAVDDVEVQSAVDQQFDEFERTQDEAWDEYQAEFLEAVGDLSEQQKTLVAESIQSFLDAQRQAEQQTVEGVRRTEATAETVQQQTEETVRTAQQQTADVAETTQEATRGVAGDAAEATEDAVAETADAIEEAAGRGAEAAEANLEAIEGVGSTYADRLSDAGIVSITDLADAQATAVAKAAEISEARAEDWIEAAQSQE